MKKFTLQILAFLLLIILMVMLWPVSREEQFNGLENDCSNHASWMYDRLYHNPASVDIAFVGSSHTINGIDDQLIESKLPDKHVLNFGYCRLGRNLDYIFAHELIETKQPEIIVLEVREFENPYSHPIFSYLATNKDLATTYPWFNKDWFSDLSLAFQYRVQLMQQQFWEAETSQPIDTQLFGRIPNKDTIDPQTLELKEQSRKKGYQPSDFKRDFDHVYPMHYLKRIAALSKETQTELVFLYIPAYGSELQKPFKFDDLSKLAPVLLPPSEIWENKDYWYDPDHLNEAGGKVLSEWVAEKL